jgi:hypothetical protein
MIKFWSENLKGRDHLEDLGVSERLILQRFVEKLVRMVWAESIWLMIVTNGGL